MFQQESLENDHPKIVFGSFTQDSDPIIATPLIPINPKIDGFSIKVEEIACSFVIHGSNSFIVAKKSKELITEVFKQVDVVNPEEGNLIPNDRPTFDHHYVDFGIAFTNCIVTSSVNNMDLVSLCPTSVN